MVFMSSRVSLNEEILILKESRTNVKKESIWFGVFLCPSGPKHLPSRELTYPRDKACLKMIFSFFQGGIC